MEGGGFVAMVGALNAGGVRHLILGGLAIDASVTSDESHIG